MILIGSSANWHLNNLVSEKLGIPLAKCVLGKFSNGETRVVIEVSIRGQDVYVISSGAAPINDNLMETLMICKACQSSNAKSITLVMANYPYARQDRKTRARECITASFVAQLIEDSGVTRLVTFDLHSGQIQGMFRIPVDNLYTDNKFATYLKATYPSINKDTHIVVAPDAGATKRCRNLAMSLNLKMALIEKSRNYTNNNNSVERMMLIDPDHSVKNKIVIIYDDIADTLGTLHKACQLLQENQAKEIIAVVTHGVLSGQALEILSNCDILTQLICTNTIPIPKSNKIAVCDISDLICACINCLDKGLSMSSLLTSCKFE